MRASAHRASGDTMGLTTFQDLLDAAHGQPEPQRLLFVFARVDLPESPTPAQRERYERREGGVLSPCLCVDKAPSELDGFEALVRESAHTGQDWDIVFVASLSGRAGVAPGADEAAQPLRLMVDAINNGRINTFAAFDRGGDALRFS